MVYAVKYGAGSNRLFQFPFVVLDLAGIRRPVVQIRAVTKTTICSCRPPGLQETKLSVTGKVLSDTMYSSTSLRKSAPPQNRQLVILIGDSKQ